MLGTGQSKHNTHTGQTTVRQGDMLIDGNLKVRGDLIIDGTLVFNGDFTINPPGCLNTDCINSVSSIGIDIGDDINLINNGNNKLLTNSINTANIGTGLRINEDYTLPPNTTTNSIGDVLTLTNVGGGFSTASFQPPGASASGRVIQNLFQMVTPRVNEVYTPAKYLYLSVSGDDFIESANIAVGGVVRFRTKGYLYNATGGGTTVFGQFQIVNGIPNQIGTPKLYSSEALFIRDVGMTGPPDTGRGWWSIEVNVVKLDASNNCQISIAGLYNCVASTGVDSTTFDLQFYDGTSTGTSNRVPNTASSTGSFPYYSPMPNFWKLGLQFETKIGDARATATEYTIDYFNPTTSILATTTAPATDHNTLANLTVGDAHIQYAKNGGRVGGQLIAGGTLGADSLILKNSVFSTNNMSLNNTNTTFEKNIDMTQNQINDVSLITNTTAALGLVGSSGTSAVVLDPDPSNSFNVLGQSDIKLQTNTDVILQSNSGFVDLNSNITRVNVGGIPKLQVDGSETTSSNNINMADNEIQNVGKITSSADLTLTPTNNVVCSTDLDMSNNNINNANTITASNNLTLNAGNNNGIIIENAPNDTIIFQKSTNHNNNVLDNVGTGVITNILNTGSANITIPVVIGTPSGALQVQNGGAYIKQDLQVDGSIYCDSINNIRPSGGLYSESSGFNIPSTNLIETNLLGQGGSSGTLVIPANTFTQFDSYSFKASGVLSGGSNDVATLRLKSLVNGTTPVELGSIIIQLTDNGLVDVAWKVEADFNVRTLGGAGVGVLVLNGNFAYTNNNDVLKTYLRTIINSSVFDTTQSNELQFTYENDGTNPLTNIRIDQASFTKWY